jgi:hypothetical protein
LHVAYVFSRLLGERVVLKAADRWNAARDVYKLQQEGKAYCELPVRTLAVSKRSIVCLHMQRACLTCKESWCRGCTFVATWTMRRLQ